MSVISVLVIAALAFPAVSTHAAPASGLDPEPQTKPATRSNETATVPQQLHRAEAPPANVSAAELESRGDDLRDAKFYLDALDYYRAAMGKAGDTALLHNKSGIALLQLMRFDQAKREFKMSIKLDPNYPEARNNLGVVEYYGKNYGKAVKYYKQAIKLNDESAS